MRLMHGRKKAKLVGNVERDTDMGMTPAESGVYSGEAMRAGDQHHVVDTLTVGDYAQGVHRIRIGEMLRVFGQQLRWALPLLLIGVAAAFWFTKDYKRSYVGQGRILAQIASEYVYEPIAGQTSPGLMITPDHIVLNEVGIMTSTPVIKQVLADLVNLHGFSAVDPVNASKLRAGEEPGDNPDVYKAFTRRIGAVPQAKSSIIDMSFSHPNPEIAVDGLNAFMDAYMQERQTLFVSGTADLVSRRRQATEAQLATNEGEIAAFLRRNNVSDFDSERKGATERTEALKTELNTLRGSIAETETALAEVEDQLRATPNQIDLFVDDRASQRVAQAELELKQLLAKYLPTSDPVRQKQTEIAELKSLQNSNGGRAAGGRRVGPNPVYQNLLERRNELASTADAQREKEIVLQRQLNSADGKTRRLRDLSPRFENLLRERETLQARLRGLNTKEQEALVAQQQAQSRSENVRVISRAETAVKGRNMRMIMFVLASAAWGGVVFLLALLATFLNPRLYAHPGGSTSHGESRPGGRRANDTVIPEPVQPYIPAVPAPQPAYAPAATYEVQSSWAEAPASHTPVEPMPEQTVAATGTDGPMLYADLPAAMYGNSSASEATYGRAVPLEDVTPTSSTPANPYL